MTNLSKYRNDFPALQNGASGQPLAYLDTASSAQKPRAVIDAMNTVMETHYANVHRGLYAYSRETTEHFEKARETVARFINASSDREIVFTRNATEAINLVAASYGAVHLKEGDEIILTEMEHHANIVPWQLLEKRMGVRLKILPVRDDGTLDMETFPGLLTPQTKFVACVHISNAMGTINDVKSLIQTVKAHNPEIKVLIDGSQAVVHGTVDVQDIGCDFYVFTGHKLYGPTGIGALWGRYDVLESMPPYQGGGDMIEQVTFEETTFKLPPARFEAGTPAIVEAIGLAAAIDYVSGIGMEAIAGHEAALLAYATDQLQALEGLTFYGPAPDQRCGIMALNAEWGHPADIAVILDECGVALRAGHHCCQPLMRRFGVDATIRASIGLYTNESDIEALVKGLKTAQRLLG